MKDYELAFDPDDFVGVDTPFNLATASPFDSIVYGAERPVYRRNADIRREDIQPWIRFMSAHGIRRVLCLLDESQLAYYSSALLEVYSESFDEVTWAPIEDYCLPSPKVLDSALQALSRAESSGQPIVVHCSAGMGRTGLVLAAWLVGRHGLEADEAISLVESHGRHFGAYRNPAEAGSGGEVLLRTLAG